MKTKISKKIFCLALALICALTAMIMPQASAKTLEEMNAEYEQIEKDIQENQEKLEEVQQDIETNEKKLENLNSQIDKINDQLDILDESIDILNDDIDSLQNDITTTTNDINEITIRKEEILLQIDETQILMDETEDMLLARIRENYMSGGSGSMVEILLMSDDISSFFARKELITRVSEEDAALVAELSEKIVQLNALQAELEEKKVALEEKETELNTQMGDLTAKQDDLESSKSAQESKKSDATKKQNEVKYLLEDLDKDSDAYKAAIKRKEKERAALEAEIEAAIKANGSTEGDKPAEEINNDGKMMWPVPGATKLTATYPSYSDGSAHWGIDIVRTDVTTKGSPFRAAQGGKVITAYNDGNWNYGFGNYCIIDHGDGKHTLYAHAQRLYVSVGDVVEKGEEIGLIGDTGNTTGPHLHFEVRIKRSDGSVDRVNPLNYVSKP
mgnify:FL=1